MRDPHWLGVEDSVSYQGKDAAAPISLILCTQSLFSLLSLYLFLFYQLHLRLQVMWFVFNVCQVNMRYVILQLNESQTVNLNSWVRGRIGVCYMFYNSYLNT